MSFKAEESNIYELFNRKIYSIPRNQRRYIWSDKNWEELYNDISLSLNKVGGHFIGSFVLTDKGRENGLPTYMVIDGQQRIITITILLSSILYWFRKKELNDDYEGTKQYLYAKDDKAKDNIMLQSDYHLAIEDIINSICNMDNQDFEKISYANLIDKNCNSKHRDSNVAKAFKYFIQKIEEQEQLSNDKDYIVKLKKQVLNMTYISIITNDDLDSYTIFEILNARGIDLEDFELLKNYIMRYISPDKERDKAKLIWNEIEKDLGNSFNKFVKHYTTHITKYNNNGKKITPYKTLRDVYQNKDKYEFLQDLSKKAKYYKKMISPQTECDLDSVEYFVLNFFRKQRQEQYRPLLISLMHQYDMNVINKKKYEESLEKIYRFYVCFHIIGKENSNRVTDLINKYSPIIEKEYSDEQMQLFFEDLRKKLPKRENFINSFNNLGYSKHSGYYEGDRNKKSVIIVLELLERYYNKGYCKDNYTIEHVLDDCLNVDNGQIGNLILLEEYINNKINRKDYGTKINAYSKSNYITTRNFSEKYFDINSFNPENRTKYLATLVYDEILNFKENVS